MRYLISILALFFVMQNQVSAALGRGLQQQA